MRTKDFRKIGSALLWTSCLGLAACTGRIGNVSGGSGSGGSGGPAGSGGMSMISTGTNTGSSTPFDERSALTAVRKAKGLLTGLGPTEGEVARVKEKGALGLQELISTWMTDQTTEGMFRAKMIGYFRNVFQQTAFTPTEDFKMQLLENGGFDFGPFGTRAVGDEVYFRLVQNIQDSFAITAWELLRSGRPFTDTLTTRRFMMTTALKALYLQIENPNDQPFGGGRGMQATRKTWQIDFSGNAIPLSETMDPASPNFMVFDDQCPVAGTCQIGTLTGGARDSCRQMGYLDSAGAVQMRATASGGYSQLFQRLIGYTPRAPFSGTITCVEHASRPYFTNDDTNDWTWVTINKLPVGQKGSIEIYDLPRLRTATELDLVIPRVGFYTTPAFLALWNTNDSNQHRVTANQTLLVALGQSFTSESTIVPLSTPALDSNHSVEGSECYGCHKSLDPMRQFWAAQLDFNDRNDFPMGGRFSGATANPRPAATGGVFAFGSMNMAGGDMFSFGEMLRQVTDGDVNRFAIAMTQQLCFYANSGACLETDPEFRRVAKAFQDSSYNFPVLIKELLSSPLVTGFATTGTYEKDAVPVSIARRDHLCASLSNRLGKPDLCALVVPIPAGATATTLRIAGSVPADLFSRGAESPVTPADPNLFFGAATELLCENLSSQIVADGSVYSTADVMGAIQDMADRVMGIPPSMAEYGEVITVLREHYDQAVAAGMTGRGTAAGTRELNALRSTFVLACESPTAVSFGL